MTSKGLAVLVSGILLSVPAFAHAQGGGNRRQGAGGPARVIGEAMVDVMKLTDQQRPKFAEVTGRFAERERAINDEERVARQSMRNLLCSGDTTRGQELARSLDQVLEFQRKRHQLIEDQQKELSTFLTPYQRARFLGMREVFAGAMGGRGGRGGRGGPPQGGPPQGGQQGPPPGMRGDRNGPPPDICAGPPPGRRGQ